MRPVSIARQGLAGAVLAMMGNLPERKAVMRKPATDSGTGLISLASGSLGPIPEETAARSPAFRAFRRLTAPAGLTEGQSLKAYHALVALASLATLLFLIGTFRYVAHRKR